MRFKSKNVIERKLDSLYLFSLHINTFSSLKIFLFRRVTDIIQCSSPETEQGMTIVSFDGFSVAFYCILVICQKK